VDAARSIWSYRDWVVDAFNADMRFDRFVTEQIAGDLLPGATDSQRVATGFHRNTMINEEGGIDKEQFRVEAVFDRVNTTGAVFLGLTLGCAQCHDHKYDPISQRDYYRIFACFNSDEDLTISVRRAGDSRTNTTMVLGARAEMRPTHLFTKGDFTRKREPVTPGIPEVFGGAELDPRTARLELARWLVSPSNPLTARVTVNRVWLRLFGVGLVETENDFGIQGSLPKQPELLDWLACEFVENGGRFKPLIRAIVMSRVYRQESVWKERQGTVDPLNHLCWRQGRVRLDAEVIRDSALAVAGLLGGEMGGASVFPPAPEGATSLGQVKRPWLVSAGRDRYRRGLYTFAWRATPFPAFTVFDAPDGTSTCTRRLRSNTPLQALTLLNDAAYYESAVSLAERVRVERGTEEERIRRVFRHCLARNPSGGEVERLRELLVGLRDLEGGGVVGDRAGWLAVARTLLNLDEFITRE